MHNLAADQNQDMVFDHVSKNAAAAALLKILPLLWFFVFEVLNIMKHFLCDSGVFIALTRTK